MRVKDWPRLVMTLGVLACFCWPSRANGQGLISPTAGPINSSMAGASTAAPIDFGSSYWNPATISGLDRSEFLIGSALIIPSIHFGSTLPAGSIGPFPTSTRSGVSRSNGGVASNLATGAAFKLADDSLWTFGIGIFGLAGGGVNFAGSNSQPVLTPRNPPQSFGVGPIYSSISTLEITPMASYQATSDLAIAAGPIITGTGASFSPAFFAPNPKDQYGLASFPNATNSRPFWGGGFQFGLFYNFSKDWNFGFSYKSPIWQERWSYNSSAPDGSARYIGVQATLPEIISWGVAYKGLPNTLIDVDLRYFDYKDASLFGQSIQNGGLAWRSVFAIATGVQYQFSDKLTLRAGYLYNTNPIPSTATLFNVQAPAIITNTLSFGASYKLTADITASAAYVHGFRNSITGGVEQLPGASTRLDAQTDSLVVGLNIQFGHSRKVGPSSAPEEYVLPAPAPMPAPAPAPAPAFIEETPSSLPPADTSAPASGEATPR
jgi:long-chain fatty acid transport protein